MKLMPPIRAAVEVFLKTVVAFCANAAVECIQGDAPGRQRYAARIPFEQCRRPLPTLNQMEALFFLSAMLTSLAIAGSLFAYDITTRQGLESCSPITFNDF